MARYLRASLPYSFPRAADQTDDHMTVEMWEDYKILKAPGLLPEWRKKWAAYLTAIKLRLGCRTGQFVVFCQLKKSGKHSAVVESL